MSGSIDFKAAIEEEKKRAKNEYERRRSSAWQTKEELVSPLMSDMKSFEPFSSIPGLGGALPVTTAFATDDSAWGKGYEEDVVEEKDISPIDPVEPIKRRQSSTAGPYAGLVSARKRKRDDPTSATQTASSRRQSMASEKARSGDADKGTSRPFAPPKKPARVATANYDEIRKIDTRGTAKTSSWYDNIDMKEKYARSDLIALQSINTLIKDCQRETARSGNLDQLFANVRIRLHKMEFFKFVSGVLIKKSKVLDDDAGLPQIFDDTQAKGVHYPWDVKLDAHMLWSKWIAGSLDPHLLRGIDSARKVRAAGKSAISHKLSNDYPRVSCNAPGDNGLHNGQWWPMQICAMRDGAHGEIEGGIHGQPGKGAYSVVLSSGGYEDLDEGDRILYCGTSGTEGKPTGGTTRLKETHKLSAPLRVLRSSGLPQKNRYRPSKGLRYDGLYDVFGYEVIDEETAMHRFELRRRPGQHPIRYQGVERRPTDDELLEYSNIRHLLGIGIS
ncbi:MAG: hypothetical protein M1816_006633 [Peltula sp. TS41687]|nr:MAG: hypothetical protein M1816_006633 [Peltula sp. TS41687]